MRKLVFLLICVVLLAGCASGSSRVSQRAVEGGAIGALLGWGIGGDGRDAATGAAVGAVAGAVVGVFEERSVRHEPTPLPWLEGERVAVYSGYGGSWRDGVRAIVEDGLRGRGAVLVTPVGRRYSDYVGATYLVEVSTARQGHEAVVVLRIIDRTDNTVRAVGEGRYYYGRFYRSYRRSEYSAFANAAEAAVEDLH
jgi:hypothetical protein